MEPTVDTPLMARYFYYRDHGHRPLVTIARLTRDDGAVAYGWAICSPDDAPQYGDMKVYHKYPGERRVSWCRGGATIAYGRAAAAFARGVQIADGVWVYNRKIQRPEALAVVESCQANGLLTLSWHGTTNALPPTMQPPPLPKDTTHDNPSTL